MEVLSGGFYIVGLMLLHLFAEYCKTRGVPLGLVLVAAGIYLMLGGVRKPEQRAKSYLVSILFFLLAAGVFALTFGGHFILPPLRSW